MSEEKATTVKSIETYIKMDKDKNVMKPLKEPTKMQVIKFKRQLATALMKCRGAPQLVGGHVYLILTESEFRLRINDPKAILPTAPEIPVAPATAEATSASVYIFREAQKAYELHTEYEQQTKDLLEKKFPNGAIGLQDEDGEIPYGTTAKSIFNHIEGKLHDDTEVNDTYLTLLQDILDMPYETSSSGAEEWFKKADDNNLLIKQLGCSPIQQSIIMRCAQRAFTRSDYDMKDILGIEKSWKIKKKANAYHADTETGYKAFKKHYNSELAILYVKQAKKPKKKAYQTEEIEEWKTAMESNIHSIHENQLELASVYQATEKHATPTEITVPETAYSASAVTQDSMKGMEDRLFARLAALQTGKPPRKDTRGGGSWRRYNKWCWSCGVNLRHNSDEKEGKCHQKRTGHVSTATKDNPQGGNEERNHLWMWWCNPENRPVEKRE
jgi:hypothetical protein